LTLPATGLSVSAAAVDGWLSDLGVVPEDRVERDGATSWDLTLDARRRFDLRVTLILEPSLGLLCWLHYAPPLNDSFRKSYRQFLRWNDDWPFVKFALSADERPVLVSELSPTGLGRDALGLALARLLAVCDVLLDESAHWLWPHGRSPEPQGRVSRHAHLLDRYAPTLMEAPSDPQDDAGTPESG
jgi:hypothetical protein